MLSRRTPAAWRKGFALHRRKAGTDRYGDAVAVYDMEHPDVTVADGDENGICWQSVRTWQSGGNLSSGGRVDAGGERVGGILEGVVYGDWSSTGWCMSCVPSKFGPATGCSSSSG